MTWWMFLPEHPCWVFTFHHVCADESFQCDAGASRVSAYRIIPGCWALSWHQTTLWGHKSSDRRNRPRTDNGAAGSRPGRDASIMITERSIKRKWCVCVCVCGVKLIKEPAELSLPKMPYIKSVVLLCTVVQLHDITLAAKWYFSDRIRLVWISTG